MFPFSNFSAIIVFLSYLVLFVSSKQTSNDYQTTLWINKTINSFTIDHLTWSDNTSVVRIILLRGNSFGSEYACGFYCAGDCSSYLFAIFILPTSITADSYTARVSSQVVWSSNRNNPVGINATLQLTDEGDLVLRGEDGTLAWSTNTTGQKVAGLNLTEMGNLVLFDAKNLVVWQSFDHPTDALVPGQTLVSGKNLTSTNGTEGGLVSVLMTEQGLVASILSNPQQVYGNLFVNRRRSTAANSYAKFQNGSLVLYVNVIEPKKPDKYMPIPQATSAQYMKLEPDGHLKVYQWSDDELRWHEVTDIFDGRVPECGYPMSCGKYGICSKGQCSCPYGTNSRQLQKHPDIGCSEVIRVPRVTCNELDIHTYESDNHTFLDLENVTYFAYLDNVADFAFSPDLRDTNVSYCKAYCLKSCSCKAVIFQYLDDPSQGQCYMPSEIFSFMDYEQANSEYNYSASIKVQVAGSEANPPVTAIGTAAKRKTVLLWLEPLLGSILGVIVVAVVIGTTFLVYQRRSRRQNSEELEEEYLDQMPGMPTRFSFQQLATSTAGFKEKLGEGGFGSVFEGSLNDGIRIAVKRLDGIGHIKKSFLAEVQTIGSIHHINLVRLIGFCAEKSHRLLVYEYMCNGSLDRWIYCRSPEPKLSWNNRRKIILDIAKGLAYLHEDCRQKIIHLDIKPQNILLDEHYNAKIADFGLSKLIDRDQSQVVTTMRGTPGYLAPEWLTAVITEKVDVYSFGVVVLEIVCGRKIFEQWRPEQERYLLTLFRKKSEEEQWMDLVDKCCLQVESNVGEVEEMMRISAWCLQNDYEKRPAMSTVIKVLEGVKDFREEIDYNFVVPQYMVSRIPEVSSSLHVTPPLPSVLSQPR